jgi:hypothetical protein
MTIRHLMGSNCGKAALSLVILALFAVTLQSVVFSDASLTADATVGHAFVTGSLSHFNSKEGVAVLDASRLSPGEARTGTLTITGGGDGNGVYTLTNAGLTDTPAAPGLSRTLLLTIRDTTTGQQLYTGTVRGFSASTASVAIAPGAMHTFVFDLQYPLAAANTALMGDSMQLLVQFTGVSQ